MACWKCLQARRAVASAAKAVMRGNVRMASNHLRTATMLTADKLSEESKRIRERLTRK